MGIDPAATYALHVPVLMKDEQMLGTTGRIDAFRGFGHRLAFLGLLGLGGCGVNDIPTYDEAATAAWSQVQNQYQRRADLVPNLVEIVKGFAAQEREILAGIVEARTRIGQMQIPREILTDPQAFKLFQDNQAALTGALARLLLIVERYPDLKSNQNFLALQSQLEGTENRIAVARRDYIEAVRLYNTELRTFPGRWWAALLYSNARPKETFAADADLQQAPRIRFGG
jgi:LemA protein